MITTFLTCGSDFCHFLSFIIFSGKIISLTSMEMWLFPDANDGDKQQHNDTNLYIMCPDRKSYISSMGCFWTVNM